MAVKREWTMVSESETLARKTTQTSSQDERTGASRATSRANRFIERSMVVVLINNGILVYLRTISCV